MNKKISYILVLFTAIISMGVCAKAFVPTDKLSAVTTAPPAQTKPVMETPSSEQEHQGKAPAGQVYQVRLVDPLAVVKHPANYLNKRINVVARFDKFATLGLDYKPAMRSSETYISFLIFRPDVENNIPLSEMKLFVTRKMAEKLIDLKEGDLITFSGTVFSTALGDAWLDVDSITKPKTSTPQNK